MSQEEKKLRRKSNSTSNVFAESTMSSPWNAEIFREMAEYVYSNLQDTDKYGEEQAKNLDIFDERAHPLTNQPLKLELDLLYIERFVYLAHFQGTFAVSLVWAKFHRRVWS